MTFGGCHVPKNPALDDRGDAFMRRFTAAPTLAAKAEVWSRELVGLLSSLSPTTAESYRFKVYLPRAQAFYGKGSPEAGLIRMPGYLRDRITDGANSKRQLGSEA